MSLELPRTVGPYKLLEELAQSRSSTVFLGEEEAGERVVVKVLDRALAADSAHCRRFRQELELGLGLKHPQVVRTLAGGVDPATRDHYIVFEHLDGVSVARLMERATPSVPPLGVWAAIAAQVAEGLSALHELGGRDRGFVHGDVGPGNIMVTKSGRVKLIDLGQARPMGTIPRQTTSRAPISGTAAYLAPERVGALGDLPIDGRADIFALGVVLYECATLRRLFRASTEEETIERIQTLRAVVAPHLLNPEIPRRFEAILIRALRREPSERYASALVFASDLNDFAREQSACEGGVASQSLSTWVATVVTGMR